jgi:hypothetical protein
MAISEPVANGLFVLGGVLVGGLLTFLAELWRQVLTARSAAWIIHQELMHNRVHLSAVATDPGSIELLSTEAWQSHRAQLAGLVSGPVLDNLALMASYMVATQRALASATPATIHAQASFRLNWYEERMKTVSDPLVKWIQGSRFAQLWLVLRGGYRLYTP